MCLFQTPKVPEVKAPTEYAQQRTPTRSDTGSAQERARMQRRRATQTLLTKQPQQLDSSAQKTLLGQ